MDIRIVNPIQTEGWDGLAQRLPGYSFFHTSSWCRVLAESYGYAPVYFTAWQDGVLRGVLPMMEVDSLWTGRRGVSLPFSDHCDPLLTCDIDFLPLLNAVQAHARERGWKFIEFRGGQKLLAEQKAAHTYLGHGLALSENTRSLEKGLRDSTRRNIRKAEKSGVSIEIGQTEEAVRSFYLLNCMTRQRHGLPPQPLRFFQKFYEHVVKNGFGTVVLARLEGKIIAGAVYVTANPEGGTVLYKYGASDKSHQHVRANNLVMWEAIRWYGKRGFAEMLMGRTDTDHDGLRQFKMGWNTGEYLIHYYRYNLNRNAFTNGNKAPNHSLDTKILQHTPLPILRALGTVLYKHFG